MVNYFGIIFIFWQMVNYYGTEKVLIYLLLALLIYLEKRKIKLNTFMYKSILLTSTYKINTLNSLFFLIYVKKAIETVEAWTPLRLSVSSYSTCVGVRQLYNTHTTPVHELRQVTNKKDIFSLF